MRPSETHPGKAYPPAAKTGPAAAVVANYIHRIVRDLDAGRHRHVIAQLDTDLWKEMLKRLGVPDRLASPTVESLEQARCGFDPHEPSGHAAVRQTLTKIQDFWRD